MEPVMSCWNCNEAVQGPVCPSCGMLQRLRRDQDHFALLGLPRRWSLDKREVERAWRKLQKRVHPDRFAGKDAAQRQLALQWTASLNTARKVLKDPHSRALYLATGKAELPERGVPGDPDFLDTVFELQMAAADDPDRVRSETDRLEQEIEHELHRIFTAWEANEGALDGVAPLLGRIKYIHTARSLIPPG
jgi:molecular chaperone HscB